MSQFKVGDHVRWNSEAGYVTGHITKVHTQDTDYKGHRRHCSPQDPQYEIKSDKTDHVAMHKGSVLSPASGRCPTGSLTDGGLRPPQTT